MARITGQVSRQAVDDFFPGAVEDYRRRYQGIDETSLTELLYNQLRQRSLINPDLYGDPADLGITVNLNNPNDVNQAQDVLNKRKDNIINKIAASDTIVVGTGDGRLPEAQVRDLVANTLLTDFDSKYTDAFVHEKPGGNPEHETPGPRARARIAREQEQAEAVEAAAAARAAGGQGVASGPAGQNFVDSGPTPEELARNAAISQEVETTAEEATAKVQSTYSYIPRELLLKMAQLKAQRQVALAYKVNPDEADISGGEIRLANEIEKEAAAHGQGRSAAAYTKFHVGEDIDKAVYDIVFPIGGRKVAPLAPAAAAPAAAAEDPDEPEWKKRVREDRNKLTGSPTTYPLPARNDNVTPSPSAPAPATTPPPHVTAAAPAASTPSAPATTPSAKPATSAANPAPKPVAPAAASSPEAAPKKPAIEVTHTAVKVPADLTLAEGASLQRPHANENFSEQHVQLQTALLSLTDDNGKPLFKLPAYGIDGRFGRETEQAVRDFQTSKQLTPSGIVDKDTLAALNADLAKERKKDHVKRVDQPPHPTSLQESITMSRAGQTVIHDDATPAPTEPVQPPPEKTPAPQAPTTTAPASPPPPAAPDASNPPASQSSSAPASAPTSPLDAPAGVPLTANKDDLTQVRQTRSRELAPVTTNGMEDAVQTVRDNYAALQSKDAPITVNEVISIKPAATPAANPEIVAPPIPTGGNAPARGVTTRPQ